MERQSLAKVDDCNVLKAVEKCCQSQPIDDWLEPLVAKGRCDQPCPGRKRGPGRRRSSGRGSEAGDISRKRPDLPAGVSARSS